MLLFDWGRSIAIGCLLTLSFGVGFVLSHTNIGAHAQILGHATATSSAHLTPVLRVVQPEASSSVIVPWSDLHQDEQNADYVLVLSNGRAIKRAVEASLWRGQYARITAGLNDQDLVILDSSVAFGQTLANFRVINPEAGPSGTIEM